MSLPYFESLQNNNQTWYCPTCRPAAPDLNVNCTNQTLNSSLLSNPESLASSDSSDMSNSTPQAKNSFKILNINCQSIRSKLPNFLALVETHSPDVIAVTETWLNPDILTSEILPPGYNLIRKDRNTGSRGGGVLLAIKQNLVFQELNLNVNFFCETAWASINLQGSSPLIIGVFYRSQITDITYMQNFKTVLDQLPPNSNLLLVGDFNMPDIDWTLSQVKPGGRYSTISTSMLDICTDLNLIQIVDKPTRHDNILDLCFTSNPSTIENFEIITGISDHDAVLIHTIFRPFHTKKPRRKIFLQKKGKLHQNF